MDGTSAGSRLGRLRATAHALRGTPALLWRADARLSVSLLVLEVCQTLVPLAQLWVAKLIIDQVVSVLRLPHPSDASRAVVVLVGIELVLAVVGLLLREAISYQRQILAERLTA